MPLRPRYKISPADRIAVEVRQPDGGLRAGDRQARLGARGRLAAIRRLSALDQLVVDPEAEQIDLVSGATPTVR
jgi:hypothetical protein